MRKTALPVMLLAMALSRLFSFMEAGAGEDRLKAGRVYELRANPEPGVIQSPPLSSQNPLVVDIENAILISLKNNRSLRVEQFNAPISGTFEDQEQAIFDPLLTGSARYDRQKDLFRSRGSAGTQEDTEDLLSAQAGVSKFFSTGTTVDLDLSAEKSRSDLYSDRYASRIGLSMTQALLRGAGTEVNLARLHQAQLATRITEYEFRGFAEALVGDVEETYWDYALAAKQIEIFEKSLLVAEHQLREIEELIAVGRIAETETTAAQAEIAEQRQGLIEAKGRADTARLKLLRLMNPPGPGLWEKEVMLRQEPLLPENALLDPVESHVSVALRLRPDLNQARLGVKSDNLEIVKTKNGLLPKMDFFISLGKTGYSDSFGGSAGNISDKYYDLSAGLSFIYPVKNRDAESGYRRSLLRRDQGLEALSNLEQLIELEVRSAYIEVTRAREQILAGEASRRLQEEKLRIETEKLRVGRSTAFLLSQAQRDLLSSSIREIKFVADYLKALVRLYRLEGSLLERRGIEAPGREPAQAKP
ncbi:MAG: TolC family protein [Desulfobacteraceae bacterium]|jgi:outer membrane protein TolC|nr:MAG: TolC family protein [Desulfobacteraceae bacterium]